MNTESNSRTTKHYFGYIAEKTGIKTMNLGVTGTGYMRRKDINRAFYQRVSDIPEDADVITIFGSGNDLSSDQTLGNVTDTGADTICGCINATIDASYERIPLARLGIVTPTPWVGSKDYRKPIVWTFHDCWPFTGHCPFYTLASCDKWKTGYFKCPKHKDYPMSYIDDSKFQYN